MSEHYEKIEGEWKPIEPGSVEEKRDKFGFTNPNLHRRTSENIENRKYFLGIHGLNSYRTTEIVTHDEESRTSEIP